jgi:hypothetical protein
MLTPVATYNGGGINPVYDKGIAACDNVAMAAGTSLRAGTVLGLVTGSGTPVNEIQTITITGAPTGGTFTLWYAGIMIGPIAYNATAAIVRDAVNAVLGAGTVTGAGGALPGTPVTLTFTGEAAGQAHVQMTTSHSLTGGASPAVAVTRSTPGKPAGGYFAAYNDAAADGSQVARGVLRYDSTTNVFGMVTTGQSDMAGYGGATSRAVPRWYKGYFRCRDLIGLDANGVGDMGHLINAAAYSESQAILCIRGA